jgi:hypothetical protein
MQRKFWAIATFIVGLVLAIRAEAVMVMPFNIEELAKRADKVFVGTCTKVSQSVNAQNIPVIEVTFTVTEAVKGKVGETVTFQQVDPQGQRSPTPRPTADERVSENPQSIFSAAAIAGLPYYTPGEEALLFLATPGKLGLTAPIGLTQGKLPVTTLASGEKIITNTSLRKTALTDGAIPDPGRTARYDRFLTVLRTITDTTHK